MGSDQFSHDRSPYERPEFQFRCGRGGLWGKPCWRGPGTDGSCGGESDCEPVHKGNRYVCRRPAKAGGPCLEGPLPDGTCAHTRPPCAPQPTLRRWRGRIALFAIGLVLATISFFVDLSGGPAARTSAIDPGALSRSHAGFTKEEGCVACHAAHGLGVSDWLKAAFGPQDISRSCLECHSFDGPERTAHNTMFPERKNLAEVACATCHTEHKGVEFSVAQVNDIVCANCHQQSFSRFPAEHPDFTDNFPHEIPNSIRFNHNRHVNKHFLKDKFKKDAPDCTDCHEIETATREVKLKDYETTCANCHNADIPKRDLVFFELPVLTEPTINLTALGKACGFGSAEINRANQRLDRLRSDDTVAIVEEVQPLAAMFIALSAEDPAAYNAPVQELLLEMAQGFGAMAARLKSLDSNAEMELLFANLNPSLLKKAACAWATNKEYPVKQLPSDENAPAGWRADDLSLRYRTKDHADDVIKQWIELVAQQKASQAQVPADKALSYILDREEGAGACGKCHAGGVMSNRQDANAGLVEWTYRGPTDRPFTTYAHAPHINLLGPDKSCKTCHRLNDAADYGAYFDNFERFPEQFVSSFHGIAKETCAECHNKQIAGVGCQLPGADVKIAG